MLPSLSHCRCTLSNWREMLALKQTKTRPRSLLVVLVAPSGSSGAVGHAAPDDAVAEAELARRTPSASRGLERRMCAPSGQRRPPRVAPRSGSRWRPVRAWGRSRAARRPGSVTSGVPLRQRPTILAASSASSPCWYSCGGVAQRARGTARRPGAACATPCRCRCARAARPARSAAGACGSHARLLVLVAEDELAERERPPAAVLARARRRRALLVLVDALDRRLREAVGEAEVLARAVEQLRVLLVDDRQCAGGLDARPAAARSASSSASVALGVDRHQHVRLAGAEAARPSARARCRRCRRALSARRRHAVAELLREGLEHALRRRRAPRRPAAVNATLSVVSRPVGAAPRPRS